MNAKLTSIIDSTTRMIGLMFITVLLLGANVSSGSILIFDDSTGTNWSLSNDTHTQTSNVFDGTTALDTTNGTIGFSYTGNLIVGGNSTLQFYLNDSATDTASTDILVRITYWDVSEDNERTINFTSKGAGTEYFVDSISTPGPIDSDSNPVTWQSVQLDLTQVVSEGWPYQEFSFNPNSDYLKGIILRSNDSSSTATMITDSVALIPEPSSLLLLLVGLGSVLLYRHKRK